MSQIKRYIQQIVEISPVAIPVAIAAFGVQATFFLLLDEFKSLYVWSFGSLMAGTAVYVVARWGRVKRAGSKKEQRICDTVALLAVLAWVIFNSLFTFQHIFTNRDPAVYANAGAWLIKHDSLRIPIPDFFEGVEGASGTSAGFSVSKNNEDELYAQGLHLLPAFLGLGGRLGGADFMLRLNPIFGGAAILALYGFIRLLVKPRWAIVASAAFASSLPLIYFSRDTYTEPLTATFTFGALSLIYIAMKTGYYKLWFLAGILAGAGTLARVDAYLIFVGLAGFVAIMLALSKRQDRTPNLNRVGLFALGSIIVATLGWLDLSTLSSGYYHDIYPKFIKIIQVIAAVLLLGAIGVFISWKTNILRWLNDKSWGWRSKAVALVVVIVSLGLISQPLWRTGYSSRFSESVYTLQQSLGIEPQPKLVDGVKVTESYVEYAAVWAVWYIGPVTALLSVGGYAYASSRVLRDKRLILLPAILVIGSTSLLYLIKPSIAPDHIWASRRLLPVILPGMTVFAAIALMKLWSLPKKNLVGMDGKVVTSILGTLAIVAPAVITLPFVNLRENYPDLTRIEKICEAVPENGAVAWIGIARLKAVQPTHTFCNTPVANLKIDGQTTSEQRQRLLKEVNNRARQRGHVAIIGVFGKEAGVLGAANFQSLTDVHTAEYKSMEQTLLRPPYRTQSVESSVKLGVINADGSIGELDGY